MIRTGTPCPHCGKPMTYADGSLVIGGRADRIEILRCKHPQSPDYRIVLTPTEEGAVE